MNAPEIHLDIICCPIVVNLYIALRTSVQPLPNYNSFNDNPYPIEIFLQN